MDTTQAQTLALDLMRHHGILSQGWTLAWANATTRAGQTVYARKEINLSVEFVRRNDVAQVRNTILHEIAHVLSPPVRVRGRWSSHGPAWKAMARSIGCTGDRETEADTGRVARPKVYEARCEGNGTPHVAATYARRPGANMLRGGFCKVHRVSISWVDTRSGQVLNPYPTEKIPAAAQTRKRAAAKPAPTAADGWFDWDEMFNR